MAIGVPESIGYDYSTSEVATGKRWINGKMIYCKVVDIGNLPNTTYKRIDVATNVSEIVSIKGLAPLPYGGTDYYMPLPFMDSQQTGNIKLLGLLTNGTAQVQIETFSDRSSATGYIIVEYTK